MEAQESQSNLTYDSKEITKLNVAIIAQKSQGY